MNANKSLIFGLINRGLVLGRCGAGSGCRQLAEVTDPARVISVRPSSGSALAGAALDQAGCVIYPGGSPDVGNSTHTLVIYDRAGTHSSLSWE